MLLLSQQLLRLDDVLSSNHHLADVKMNINLVLNCFSPKNETERSGCRVNKRYHVLHDEKLNNFSAKRKRKKLK